MCREILQVSPGIAQDEALAEVVGFLEVCRDRLVDIIEAGTSGLLGEVLFAQVLKTNDTVLKTLDAERNGTKIPVDDEFLMKGGGNNMLLDLSDNDDYVTTGVMKEDVDSDKFSLLDLKPGNPMSSSNLYAAAISSTNNPPPIPLSSVGKSKYSIDEESDRNTANQAFSIDPFADMSFSAPNKIVSPPSNVYSINAKIPPPNK